MYQALYRKYRSQTFGEMVGQEVVATTLKQAVDSGKISHAYLFSGPRGTGKTSAAKIFAKAMNCPNQVDGEPCNHCDLCQDITNGSLEDVIEIDAASNNGVDEIREIRDKSTYAPSRATYKVYIIDEVHMLSTGAFNALLKTLEEPTANVVFILATTELHKIPATILSRVQRFEFKAIKAVAIEKHLASVLGQEAIAYDEEAIALIARRAEGSMRDALSILDQALSLTTTDKVSLEIAEEITGSIGRKSLDDYVGFVIAKEPQKALSSLAQIFDSGKSMSRFATDLLHYFRDLLVVQAGGEVGYHSQAFSTYLDVNQELIFRMIDIITKSLPEVKHATQPKIYAEMMTIKLAHVGQEESLETAQPNTFNEQLQALATEVAQLKQALETLRSKPQQTPVVKSKPVPKQSFKVDREKVITIMQETVADSQQSRQYLEALKSSWNEILDSISAQDRALLLGSEPVLANSENAILAFDAAFNAQQAMKRQDLNAIFGNIMSQTSGFSPNIMAIPRKDFNDIRREFAHSIKAEPTPSKTEKTENLIPEAFEFLADKITIEEN